MRLNQLERFFPVRPGEWRLTLLLFFHGLLAVGAFLTGRSVRDALFLAHAGQAALPKMYLLTALALTAVGLLYSRAATRVRGHRAAAITLIGFSLLFLVAFQVERAGGSWVYTALYLLVEVMGGLCLTQYWSLANELFDAREAKRLYGFIGAGGTLANVLFGYLGAKVAHHFGASALMLLCAGQLFLASLVCAASARVGKRRLRQAPLPSRSSAPPSGFGKLFASSHLRTVATLAVLTSFTTALVDFEFKVTAAEHFSKDALAGFFSSFYAWVGGLALLLQLFGTSRLLNRFGVVGALSILPLSLLSGNLAVALFPVLLSATLAKGADTLFRYTLNDATTQILYLPVSSQIRSSAKAVVDNVLKPTAMGAAGLLLLGYRSVAGGMLQPLAVIAALACLGWGLGVWRLRFQYIRSLQENLRRRRLDLDSARYRVNDASTGQVLTRALQSPHPREVLNALELLPHFQSAEADRQVSLLFSHPLPQIRVAALDYFAQRGSLQHARSVLSALSDGHPEVRARAILSLCALLKDKAGPQVRPYLSDPSPALQSAAMVGMIQHGGLHGLMEATAALESLLASPSPEFRRHAASVLGTSGQRNFYRPLLALMNDSDGSVRAEAVRAAAKLKCTELVLPLLAQAQRPELAREAVEALCAYGPSVVPTLGKVLANRVESLALRRAVVRALGRLGTPEAAELMCEQLDELDEGLRSPLFRALAKCVKGKRLAIDPKRLGRALDHELVTAWSTVQSLENLERGKDPAAQILSSALEEKRKRSVERIFLLLSTLHPQEDMERVHSGLSSGAAGSRERANAVELLDNLLPLEVRRRLLPLLEEGQRAAQLQAVQGMVELSRIDAHGQLLLLCADGDPWVRACALHVAAAKKLTGAAQPALEAAEDERWFVREMGIRAAGILAPEEAALLAERHGEDDVPPVRAAARLLKVA